jgi:hypothetical protein
MTAKTVAVAAMLLLNAGCDQNTIEVTTIARDSAGVRLIDVQSAPSTVAVWSLDTAATLVLTGGESGDSTAFANVGSVRWLPDSALVVGDAASSRLLIYDEGGRFLKALGRRGDGPGELRRLGTITVAGDLIATFDASLRRLSFWHPDSGFVRSVNLADGGSLESFPTEAFPWGESSTVVLHHSITPQESVPAGTGVRRWPSRMHLTMRDSDGRVLRTSPPFDGEYSGLDERGDLRLPFSHRPFVAAVRDRIFFGSGERFEIAWHDSSFALAGVVRWPGRDERLTSEEVERVRGEAIATISRRPLPANPFAKHFAPEILPANRPSIGRVFVDAEGNVWVERFEAARMGMPQVPGELWSVLDRDGQPLAILKLPSRTRLEDVRGNEVIVVRRDSLDVQSVAIHRLKR